MLRVGHKTVIALLAILAISILGWLPSSNYTQIYKIILEDTFELNSNVAIKINTPVTFNGVVVGKLEDIKFNTKNPREVHLTLAIKSDTPITQGTLVLLNRLPHITLIDDGANVKPLLAQTGQTYPTITTVKTTQFKVNASTWDQKSSSEPTTASQPNTDSTQSALNEISQSLKKQNELLGNFLNDDNTESIKQLIYSLQEISAVMSANKDKIGNLIVKTDNFIDEVKPTLQIAQKTLQLVNTQTLPQVYPLLNNLNDTATLAQELMMTLNQNPTVFIRGKSTPKLGPGETIRSRPKYSHYHRGYQE